MYSVELQYQYCKCKPTTGEKTINHLVLVIFPFHVSYNASSTHAALIKHNFSVYGCVCVDNHTHCYCNENIESDMCPLLAVSIIAGGLISSRHSCRLARGPTQKLQRRLQRRTCSCPADGEATCARQPIRCQTRARHHESP